VAGYGPQALSDPAIMERVCRDRLAGLPGESALIGSAARANVPAMLRERIPRLGNYGAIQAVATALAGAHELDNAAAVWVVREYARAMGLIAPGHTGPGPAAGPGQAAGSGQAAGPGYPAGSGQAAGPGYPAGPGQAAGPGGPGVPPPQAGGRPPGRHPEGSRLLNRNTLGVAAAIALVAGYLGVAAVAHLSPFPAKTVAVTTSQSPSTGTNTGASTSASPGESATASPDASPTSDYDILLTKIPGEVQSQGSCRLTGTQVGATAVSQCQSLTGLGATTIIYYLFKSPSALATGFSGFLTKQKFSKTRECTTGRAFTDFLTECRSDFSNTRPPVTGSVAEYANPDNLPIIVSTDSRQNVMAVMVGTNAGDLLGYWKQMKWVVTG
jgi:hypothetical protein